MASGGRFCTGSSLIAYPLDCSSLRLLSMFFRAKGSTWYTAVAYIARGKAACMHIIRRENQVERERAGLSQDAMLSCETEGRARSAEPDFLRNEFQRDRDKIIHAKSFRRLSHKTQVFIAPEGDHFRTRLTHTLEVAQIARTIARALGLNEDLTEAVALGHDLGHTPFGHTGEEALAAAIGRHRGISADDSRVADLYRHNVQSLRVVEFVENEGRGLNLTSEVRDGIVCHTGPVRAETLEGRIVAVADRIAYVNHDIDDAIRAGILEEKNLPESTHAVLGSDHSARIETLVTDAVVASAAAGDIRLSDSAFAAMGELREFLFDSVYKSEPVLREVAKAQHLIAGLFDYFVSHPKAVPAECLAVAEGDVVRAVTDYIAGMTDRYATRVYQDLFIPQPAFFLVCL